MKKNIVFIIVGFALIVASVLLLFDDFAFNKSQEIVDTRQFLENYDTIQLDGPFDVVLSSSEAEKINIKTDIRMLAHIKTKVEDSVLVIYTDGWAWLVNKKAVVEVEYKDIKKLILNGSGNISGSDVINNEKIDIALFGSGNMNLNVDTSNIDANISGSGNIDLSGKTNQHQIDIFGSGNYNAKKLESNFCKLNISGSGNANVNVTKTLVGNISGSGNIYYAGLAQIVESITGTGKIIKQ